MKKFARFLLVAIVALIVGAAVTFVWGMQREIDVTAPEARAQLTETMTLGCKLRLPEVTKKAQMSVQLSPDQVNGICTCATDRIIEAHAVDGKIRPSAVTEEATDEIELACLKEQTAQ